MESIELARAPLESIHAGAVPNFQGLFPDTSRVRLALRIKSVNNGRVIATKSNSSFFPSTNGFLRLRMLMFELGVVLHCAGVLVVLNV